MRRFVFQAIFRDFVRFYATGAKRFKLETPLFSAILTDELKTLSRVFEGNKFQLKIAGGAVRDLLMGIRPHDVDLATDAKPEEMLKMFDSENIRVLNLKGLKHGTVPVRINDKVNYEITTLRIDVKTFGRHAEVEFTNDWHADAIRRDLTVNALFLEMNGDVIDYVNGVEDLRNKIIRFVGIPDKRIKEDYLRILRYFRFYSRVCDNPSKHDLASLKAIRDNIAGLELISGERIGYEFRKILAQKFSDVFMKLFYEFKMPKYLGLPEDGDLNGYSSAYRELFSHGLKPFTLLAFLFKTDADVERFRDRIKLSNEENYTLNAVFKYQNKVRQLKSNDEVILYLKKLMLHPHSNMERHLYKTEAVELLKAANKPGLIEAIQATNLPKFELNREDILELSICDVRLTNGQVTKVRDLMLMKACKIRFNQLLNDLKINWIESDFKATKDDLLKSIDAQFLDNYIVYKKNKKK